MKILMLLVVGFPALLQAQLKHFAVEGEDVLKAACNPVVPSLMDMEIALSTMWNIEGNEKGRTDEVIMGVSLKQQSPTELSVFKSLVTPINGLGYTGVNPQISERIQRLLLEKANGDLFPFVKSKKSYNFKRLVPKDCTGIFCASKAIFGYEQAVQILWLISVYGVNASHFTGHYVLGTEYIAPWRKEDLAILIRAYAKLPPSLSLEGRPSTIAIFKESLDLPTSRTKYATANMLFGGLWRKEDAGTKEAVVFHELAHNMAFAAGLQDGNYRHTEWLVLTGWSQAKPKDYISNYAGTHADEDLAESITAYRYMPQSLKTVSPLRYDFIKKYIFNGREFLSALDCTK